MIKDPKNILFKKIFENIIIEDSNILEIGFGNGELVDKMSNMAKTIIGIETDPNLVSNAKERIKKDNVSFLLADSDKLEMENASFDVILFVKSLHHILPWKIDKTLQECHRVLKKQGGLLIIEPIYKGGSYEEIVSIYNDEEKARNSAENAIRKSITNGLFKLKKEETFKLEYLCDSFQDLFESVIKTKKWVKWKDSYKKDIENILNKNKIDGKFILSLKLKLFLLGKN